MRQLGTLPSEQEARIFCDYLLTQGVKSRTDGSDDEWTIWVYDEDQVQAARDELAAFRSEPSAERYRDAAQQAASMRASEQKQNERARKNVIDVRKGWERSPAAKAPVTLALIGISLLVAVSSSTFEDLWKLCDKFDPVVKALSIAPYEIQGQYIRWSGLSAVKSGQIWRLVTPIFIHFNILHIAFNMLWLRDLGAAIEVRRRSLRFLLLVLTLAVTSNLAQYFLYGPEFGGMSGVVYGLFGYLWMKSRFEPQFGYYMHPNIVFLMLGWLIVCYLGWIGDIANGAHTAGLVAGIILGYAPKLVRDLAGR